MTQGEQHGLTLGWDKHLGGRAESRLELQATATLKLETRGAPSNGVTSSKKQSGGAVGRIFRKPQGGN